MAILRSLIFVFLGPRANTGFVDYTVKIQAIWEALAGQ
jgi:hypothetical protein